MLFLCLTTLFVTAGEDVVGLLLLLMYLLVPYDEGEELGPRLLVCIKVIELWVLLPPTDDDSFVSNSKSASNFVLCAPDNWKKKYLDSLTIFAFIILISNVYICFKKTLVNYPPLPAN